MSPSAAATTSVPDAIDEAALELMVQAAFLQAFAESLTEDEREEGGVIAP